MWLHCGTGKKTTQIKERKREREKNKGSSAVIYSTVCGVIRIIMININVRILVINFKSRACKPLETKVFIKEHTTATVNYNYNINYTTTISAGIILLHCIT